MPMYINEIGRMLALPHGAARHRADACVAAGLHHRVAGQEGHEVLRHADRAHARAAAAVRDAEGLVQVQVADVGADVARAGRGRPARSCSRRPCTPGRRARARSRRSRGCSPRTRRASTDTSPSAPRACPCSPRPSPRRSATSMLPRASRLHDDDLHARHHRARRVGAVRRLRNQADVAMRLAARLVVAANHEQAGVLALRAGVRLQRHGVRSR